MLPLRRTRGRLLRPTLRAQQRGPSGGLDCDGGARPRGDASVAPQADTRATSSPDPEGGQRGPEGGDARDAGALPGRCAGGPSDGHARLRRPTPMARKSAPSGGHARDGGARTRRRAGASPQANRRAKEAPDPTSLPVPPLKRTRARQRCTTPTACRRSPSRVHARDGGARPRGCAGATRRADTHARAAADPEGTPARLLRRTRVRRRCPTQWPASAAPQADKRATAAPDLDVTPVWPLRRTRARRRRPTPRKSQRGPTGGQARDGGTRNRAPRRRGFSQNTRFGGARPRGRADEAAQFRIY